MSALQAIEKDDNVVDEERNEDDEENESLRGRKGFFITGAERLSRSGSLFNSSHQTRRSRRNATPPSTGAAIPSPSSTGMAQAILQGLILDTRTLCHSP